MGNPSRQRWLWVILLVALGLRLAGGVVVTRQIESRNGEAAKFLFPDSDNFYAYAKNLSTTGDYVDEVNRRAWRTPAYSILLAGCIAVGVEHPQTFRWLNYALDLLNVYLAFVLGGMFFTRRAGFMAAGFVAVYPFFIYFSNLMLADTLSVTATLLITLCAARLLNVRGADATFWQTGLAAGWLGLTLAVAVMVKASFAFLGILLMGFLLLRLKRGAFGGGEFVPARSMPDNHDSEVDSVVAETIPHAATAVRLSCRRQHTAVAIPLILLTFALGMMPWWARNYRVYDTFVPFSTMGGFTLYESNSEFADGGPNNDKIVFPYAWRKTMTLLADWQNYAPEEQQFHNDKRENAAWHELIMPDRLERTADAILREAAQEWIKENPTRFGSLMPTRFLRTWNIWPNYDKASGWKYKLLSLLTYLPVMLLMVYGGWVYRSRWREVYLLLLPAIYFAALHSVFMGSIRYRLPAMGCLIVLAAGGLDVFLHQRKQAKYRKNVARPSCSTSVR